ncbi:endochitinase A-like [Thrips palmi]|uniref:Endochitinase A-like n=1 Tax=Thrips palmi TaxID=161013 RepID=A0A6P8YKM3_THRPL|nr:endochitinase A-like [Thrips palmi]
MAAGSMAALAVTALVLVCLWQSGSALPQRVKRQDASSTATPTTTSTTASTTASSTPASTTSTAPSTTTSSTPPSVASTAPPATSSTAPSTSASSTAATSTAPATATASPAGAATASSTTAASTGGADASYWGLLGLVNKPHGLHGLHLLLVPHVSHPLANRLHKHRPSEGLLVGLQPSAKPAAKPAPPSKPVAVTLVALKKPLKGHHKNVLHRSGGLTLPAEPSAPGAALYSDAEDDEYPQAVRPCAHDAWRTAPAVERQDWGPAAPPGPPGPVEAEQWVRGPPGGLPQQQQQWTQAPAFPWPWPGSASSTSADPWGVLQWPRMQQMWRTLLAMPLAMPPHY